MMEWWNARDARERLLLTICAALVALVSIVQLGVVPSMSYRERAANALEREVAINEEVRAVAATKTDQRATPSDGRPLQAIVSDTSSLFGLEVNRMAPTDQGGLNLWLEAEPPQPLYAWLVDLERVHGVRVGKASIRWNSDQTTISANLYVEQGL
ncbi:MAG: type II secretion system protein GspM [Pseudomonadota bacterium]